jgi:hypothetical protein
VEEDEGDEEEEDEGNDFEEDDDLLLELLELLEELELSLLGLLEELELWLLELWLELELLDLRKVDEEEEDLDDWLLKELNSSEELPCMISLPNVIGCWT